MYEDQLTGPDDFVLSTTDQRMLRNYDLHTNVPPQPLLVRSVEDRKNDIGVKCPRGMKLGPDRRFPGYPYEMRQPDDDNYPVSLRSGKSLRQKPDVDPTLVFILMLLCVVAVCVYVGRAVAEIKEFIRDMYSRGVQRN